MECIWDGRLHYYNLLTNYANIFTLQIQFLRMFLRFYFQQNYKRACSMQSN